MSGRTSARLPLLALAARAVALLALAGRVEARAGLTQDEALRLVFPEGTKIEARARFLTRAELAEAARRAELPVETEIWTQHVGLRKDGTPAGIAYFDTHRVRTEPETLLVLVSPDGAVERVEVVVFREPPEYLPKEAWYRQFNGRKLDPELHTRRGIRAVTGATLSARAATDAVRRVLAVHAVLEAGRTRGRDPRGGEGRTRKGGLADVSSRDQRDTHAHAGPRSAAVSRAEARALHLAMLVVALSGALYAVSRYLLPHDDPFSSAGSAWEPWALAAHVLAAPVLVFAVGLVFRRHVLRKLREGRPEGRRSGRVVLWVGGVSAATGYVFEVLTADGVRRVFSIAHIATGVVMAIAYTWHAPLSRLRASAVEGDGDGED